MNNLRRILLLSSAVLALSLSCGQHQGSPFQASETSNCGGFSTATRQNLIPVNVDTVNYCTAERLYWSYDGVAGIVSLMLTRVLADCAVKPVFSGAFDGETIALTETVPADTTGAPYCKCAYDSYAEVTGMTANSVLVTLAGIQYTINFSEGQGSLIVNSVPATASCPK